MKQVVITGGSSGLGAEIKTRMYSFRDAESFEAVQINDWSFPEVDITESESIASAVDKLGEGPIDILINNAGVNEVNWLPDMKEADWDKVMGVNTKGIFLVTQALIERLRGGTILNIVSNAARVPMRASSVYNASKAATAMLTRQFARELGDTHKITVFGVAPNKLSGTAMSKYIEGRVQETRGWTEEQARQYQLDGLPAHEETDPKVLAEFIAFLLSEKRRHKYLQGCILEYGGPV